MLITLECDAVAKAPLRRPKLLPTASEVIE